MTPDDKQEGQTFEEQLQQAVNADAERVAAEKAEKDAQAALEARLEQAKEDAIRRAEIRRLERLVTAENHRRQALGIIRDLAPVLSPPSYVPPQPRPVEAPRHTWGLVISDWQLGQLTPFGATGQVFHQTTEVTKHQVHDLWERVEQQLEIESHGKVIEELVIFDLGDIIEGDQMRPSQAWQIDSNVTRQAVDATDLEAWLIRQALGRFPKVRVLKVGGNHDRTSQKPGNAGLGELGYTDTYSWLIGEFLKRLFETSIAEGRLEFENFESFFGTAMVAGHRCVFEHGASFRASTGSYGGISYYSIANAAKGYMEMLGGADLILMGHHHCPMVLPMARGWGWQVMNGALPPSSQFAQSNFKSVGRPCQVLIDLHHEVGLTGWKPLYLDQKDQVRPGSYWLPPTQSAA